MDTAPDDARLWLAAGWTVVVVCGATTTAELRRACDCALVLLRHHRGGVVGCDLSRVTAPDIAAVDALSRLRLTAIRHGASLCLRPISPQLHRLVHLAGLEQALLD